MDENSFKKNENETTKRINREQIIAAAEKLFLEKHFEDTSMDDVSKLCGLTKRTIYKHFSSKEDLFFAVVVEATKKFIAYSEKIVVSGSSALEKIKQCNQSYCQFYIENPGLFRLMIYQPDNLRNCEASHSRQELRELKDAAFEKYSKIIEEGRADGSINDQLDTKKLVCFGLFASMGLLNLVSNMDQKFFWENQRLDEIEFLNFSMELLARALS